MSKIKVYTIQNVSVLNKVLKTGEYRTDKRFICERSFKDAYAWLVKQAKNHKQSWKEDRPVWVWIKRPDLRQHKYFSDDRKSRVEKKVLIELEIDEKDILISDFDTWHCVLNDCLYFETDQEWDNFNSKYKKNGKLSKQGRKILEQSWLRCLNHAQDEYKQGIIESIRVEDIRSVKKFDSINKK